MIPLLALVACAHAPPVPPVTRAPAPREVALDTLSVSPGGPTHGRPDAPIVIVMVSDFGCPHCARAWTALAAHVDAHPDVQLRVTAYPLSSACNLGSGDPVRCDLAIAAACAHAQGRFRPAADVLFADPTRDAVLALPAKAGLDAGRFQACLRDPGSRDALQEEIAEATRTGAVQGTPTFWVFRDRGPGGLFPSAIPAEVILEAERLAGRAHGE